VTRRELVRWAVWYAAATALAMSVLVLAIDVPLANAFSTRLGGAFIVLALPGHFFAFALVASTPAFALALLGAPRAGYVAALVCAALLLAVVAIDAKVFQLYRFHLDGVAFEVMTGGAAGETFEFSTSMWLGSTALLAAALAGEVALGVLLRRVVLRRGFRARGVALAMVAVMALGQGIYAYADAVGYQPVTFELRFVPWAQPVTVRGALARLGVPVARRSERLVEPSGRMHYPRVPLACAALHAPNVVMLVIDSARFDMLSEDVMPNTWSLAQQSVVFDRHFSTGNATRFGIFGLLYGLPGSYWFAALGEQRGAVLIDELRRAGYALWLYGAAPLTSPEFDRTAFAAARGDIAPHLTGTPVERDRGIARAFIARLAEQPADAPYFAFLFFDAPHAFAVPDGYAPFAPMLDRVDYLELAPDYDRTAFFNRYRASVKFDDQLVGDVLHALESTPSTRETIVLVTSDHGQAFNEDRQNEWGHNNSFSRWEVQVPFVLRWPGETPRHVGAPSSHMDWAPTLMRRALGCSNRLSDYSTGEDLFDLPDGPRIMPVDQWARRAVIDGDLTYEFERWGEVEVRDANHESVPGARPRPAALATVLEWQGRFLLNKP